MEKINYTKLCRLLVDGGTQAVRSVFDGIHPPSSLKANLNANKTTLQTLKKSRGKVLNNDQWDKLYPASVSDPKSEDFDITLLFVLLRNICGLTPPATGWDVLPPGTDTSQEANLVRIKYYRNNTVAHKPNTEINDADFEQHWQDISSALLSLGLSQDDIDDLKSAPLGEKDYKQLLHEWCMSDEDIKSQLDKVKSNTGAIKSHMADLKSDTEYLKSDTADIKSNTALIPGIQEDISQLKTIYSSAQFENSIVNQLAISDFSSLIESLCKSFHPNTRQWILDDVKSHIHKDPSKNLSEDPYENRRQPEPFGVLITAGPGMGKSTIAARICQAYKNLGCLAGCHFFQFSNSTRNNPRLMLQSIARQMCDTVPGYREALESKLRTNFGRNISDLKCEELFTVLLEEPCNKIKMDDVTEKRLVIVVDAMDECCNNLKSEFLNVLEYKLKLLPSWLRFVITTRPSNSHGVLKLKNFDIGPKDQRNKDDLSIFFEDKLSESSKSDDLSKLVSSLLQASNGLFLVAFFIVDYLQKEQKFLESEVLSLFPKGISSVYEKYFDRLKDVLVPCISHERKFFEMLKAIVAAKYPIEKNVFYRILGLKSQRQLREIPGLSIKSQKAALDLLHSLFPVENDHVTVFHKSVVDWLIHEDIDHEFSVRAEVGSSEVVDLPSHNYKRQSWESLQEYDLDVCSVSKNQYSAVGDIQSSNEELLLKKDECTIPPHDFIVSVKEGNEVLAIQCYDVLSDIRNGKKDLDKPLNLTDSEKYALEYGIQYITDSRTLSNEKKMEVLMNCFVICSAILYHRWDDDLKWIPLKSNSSRSHFDVSREVPNALYHGFGNVLYDEIFSYPYLYSGDHHVKPCPFSLPLNFIHCVGHFVQAVKVIGLNEGELSPNPKALIEKYRLPFLSCNHIAVIQEEEFYSTTSVIGLLPINVSLTEVVILPCKDGMIIVKYGEGQTMIQRHIEDGTLLNEETFSGLKKMCITPDQRFIVATEIDKRGEVEIIDATSLKLLKKYQAPNVVKTCHVFGNQPWYIIARCYNNKIYVMEGETGKIHNTFDVEKDEEVEAVSSSGHVALSKTWVSIEFSCNALFTDDDGNFLEEMSCSYSKSHSVYRKLFLLNALETGERLYLYPRREILCSCRNYNVYRSMGDFSLPEQEIAFSQDGKLLAFHYWESIFIVRSEDGSLLKRVYVEHIIFVGGRNINILHLSDNDIILGQNNAISIIDVTTNQIKHLLYLPGNPKKVFVIPRQQGEPLAILVKNDNDKGVREESSKKHSTVQYSIFRYVFHNIDL